MLNNLFNIKYVIQIVKRKNAEKKADFQEMLKKIQ